ncbi:MAG: MBL fold metallo-hydrolase [Gemmatimonadales bacterium]|nr:MBL fold metallo-hydrolase [Gemmatimonadales bacterium]
MRLTLLGTGTSFGVPQIGCGCGVCLSTDPRDRRYRAAAAIDTGAGTILIDTPPELRLQLLAAGVAAADAVLFTHKHADHVAGIDDLRAFSVRKREALPLYANEMTRDFLLQSYQYIFDPGVTAVPGTSKPRLEMHVVEPWRPFTVAGVEVLPLPFLHGPVDVLGFRIGRLAYITDVKAVPQDAREALTGLDVLVINALWWRQHPTHQSIPEAIEAAQAIGARRTYLTHLSHETGHAKLAESLPDGIEPGYDGLTLEIAP